MARPKGVRELSREVQGGALRYLKMEADKGRPVSDIWADLFKDDKFKAMQLLISIMPKQIDAELTENINVNTNQLAQEVLQQVIKDKNGRPESGIH